MNNMGGGIYFPKLILLCLYLSISLERAACLHVARPGVERGGAQGCVGWTRDSVRMLHSRLTLGALQKNLVLE